MARSAASPRDRCVSCALVTDVFGFLPVAASPPPGAAAARLTTSLAADGIAGRAFNTMMVEFQISSIRTTSSKTKSATARMGRIELELWITCSAVALFDEGRKSAVNISRGCLGPHRPCRSSVRSQPGRLLPHALGRRANHQPQQRGARVTPRMNTRRRHRPGQREKSMSSFDVVERACLWVKRFSHRRRYVGRSRAGIASATSAAA